MPSIDGTRLTNTREGNREHPSDARENEDIILTPALWRKDVDVTSKDEFEITFQVVDKDVISDDYLGFCSPYYSPPLCSRDIQHRET